MVRMRRCALVVALSVFPVCDTLYSIFIMETFQGMGEKKKKMEKRWTIKEEMTEI